MLHHAAYDVPLDRLSVAVVDDITHMTDLFAIMLGAIKVARTRTFNDVNSFILHCRKDPPHVLITDLAMQPTSGFSLINLLRQKEMDPLCHVAIVAASAHATRDNIKQSLLGGANDFLAKPLSANTIRSCLERVTRDPRQLILEQDRFVLANASIPAHVDCGNIETGDGDGQVLV